MDVARREMYVVRFTCIKCVVYILEAGARRSDSVHTHVDVVYSEIMGSCRIPASDDCVERLV